VGLRVSGRVVWAATFVETSATRWLRFNVTAAKSHFGPHRDLECIVGANGTLSPEACVKLQFYHAFAGIRDSNNRFRSVCRQ